MPVTITWTTGLPGARIQPDVTKTYSGKCLLTLGIGFKATASVGTTVVIDKAPKYFAEKGMTGLASAAGKVAVVANNPVSVTGSVAWAAFEVFKHCECNSGGEH
jgi:hypothetical protein